MHFDDDLKQQEYYNIKDVCKIILRKLVIKSRLRKNITIQKNFKDCSINFNNINI